MKLTKKLVSILLALTLVAGIAIFSASAVNTGDKTGAEVSAANTGITVHYYQPDGVPTIYYWNSLPENIEVDYPGAAMTNEGGGWYSKSFPDVTKINMIFVYLNCIYYI